MTAASVVRRRPIFWYWFRKPARKRQFFLTPRLPKRCRAQTSEREASRRADDLYEDGVAALEWLARAFGFRETARSPTRRTRARRNARRRWPRRASRRRRTTGPVATAKLRARPRVVAGPGSRRRPRDVDDLEGHFARAQAAGDTSCLRSKRTLRARATASRISKVTAGSSSKRDAIESLLILLSFFSSSSPSADANDKNDDAEARRRRASKTAG